MKSKDFIKLKYTIDGDEAFVYIKKEFINGIVEVYSPEEDIVKTSVLIKDAESFKEPFGAIRVADTVDEIFDQMDRKA